ncbi:hypothetical protein [Prescottella equi]
MPFAKPTDEAAIRVVLSAPRSSTYVTAAGGDTAKAMALYGWNARVAAALMLPSHFAEVATRNAVSDALAAVYGARWPWNTTFEQSLPAPKGLAYNPQRDLLQTRKREHTTGKVIAELKFAFWQSMFTARHDVRVWDHQILTLFPNAAGITAPQLRTRIYGDLEGIRKLRNRVAHHEPIFTRNLADDLTRMLDLVELRSTATAQWVRAMEEVSTILTERP